MTRDLAPWACRPETSRGRVVAEPESALRTPYQRDRDRIVHSTAFRRLEHKTQVLVTFEGDHFRTRLTHSLEVAQIARTIARALGADEDLAEALALAHDLGHTPFGHAGEHALRAALEGHGGFDHNVQSFRVVTKLEQRYAAFDGLNLTAETLEGLAKHNGPLPPILGGPDPMGASAGTVPGPIASHPLADAMALGLQAGMEAQIAAIADDVAYCNHDIDDGLRASFFTVDDLLPLPQVAGIVADLRARHPGIAAPRLGHELNRQLIDRMVADLLGEARRRLEHHAPRHPDDIRQAPEPMIAFAPAMAELVAGLRAFLHERMYRQHTVNRMSLKAGRLVGELARVLLDHPDCLPERWRSLAQAEVAAAGPGPDGNLATAGQTIRDYIAGMTDRFASDEHDRLFRFGRERP